MGDTLTIRGAGFGAEQDESSYISIGGIIPTVSSYGEWRDDYITVKIPEFGDSGLVYVYRNMKKSNPALFSNRALMPQPLEKDVKGKGPVISSVEPNAGTVGSLVTIRGDNFGASREGSAVYFPWAVETSPAAPAELGPPLVEVFENDLGYEVWSDREIQVRVPNGAISGNLEVRTPRGRSNPELFTLTDKPGTQIYKDKRTYSISYSVNIKVREASSSNTLYLWMPKPVNSTSQGNTELLSRNISPFIEHYRGVSLYQLKDLQAGSQVEVALSYLVEVYAVETAVRPSQIRPGRSSPLESVYTLPSALLPSDDPRIKRRAALIIEREQNPYLKAQKIYQWLIKEGGIHYETLKGGAIEALEGGQADPYMAAILFCTLARAAGLPSVPVAGVLVDRYAAKPHFWAEFWIEGFGWVPVDPALGAGAVPDSFNLRDDAASYYFGNLDNRRIAFSRGQTVLSPMAPQGRITPQSRNYSLQTLWEEVAGGLESYSSLWSDVTITGIYAE